MLVLPRDGVPVAYEVARALQVPVAVFVIRKLGLPGREEPAMGAIASGGVIVLNVGKPRVGPGRRSPSKTGRLDGDEDLHLGVI